MVIFQCYDLSWTPDGTFSCFVQPTTRTMTLQLLSLNHVQPVVMPIVFSVGFVDRHWAILIGMRVCRGWRQLLAETLAMPASLRGVSWYQCPATTSPGRRPFTSAEVQKLCEQLRSLRFTWDMATERYLHDVLVNTPSVRNNDDWEDVLRHDRTAVRAIVYGTQK